MTNNENEVSNETETIDDKKTKTTKTQTKRPNVTLADTGSDVDMDPEDVESIRHKLKIDVEMKPSYNLGYFRTLEKTYPLYGARLRLGSNKLKEFTLNISTEERTRLVNSHVPILKYHYTPTITPHGQFGYWPRKVPYGNNPVRDSHTTAKTLWIEGQKMWVMGIWVQEDWLYEMEEATSPETQNFPSEEELAKLWPTQFIDGKDNYHEMLTRGLYDAGLIIDDPENPLLKRARHEIA